MTTGFKKNVADIDTLFEPRTTGDPQAANTGYKVNGVDISTLFYPLANGGTAPAAIGMKVGGLDLNTIFAAIGTVIITPPASGFTVLVSSDNGYVFQLEYTDRWKAKVGSFIQIAPTIYDTLITVDDNYVYVVIGSIVYIRGKDSALSPIRTINLSSLFQNPTAVRAMGKSIAITNNKLGITFSHVPAPGTGMQGTFVVVDLSTDTVILSQTFNTSIGSTIITGGVFAVGNYLITSRDVESLAYVFNTSSNSFTTFTLGSSTFGTVMAADSTGVWTRHQSPSFTNKTLNHWLPDGAWSNSYDTPWIHDGVNGRPDLDIVADITNNILYAINKRDFVNTTNAIAYISMDAVPPSIMSEINNDADWNYNATFLPAADKPLVISRHDDLHGSPWDIYSYQTNIGSPDNFAFYSCAVWTSGTTLHYLGGIETFYTSWSGGGSAIYNENNDVLISIPTNINVTASGGSVGGVNFGIRDLLNGHNIASVATKGDVQVPLSFQPQPGHTYAVIIPGQMTIQTYGNLIECTRGDTLQLVKSYDGSSQYVTPGDGLGNQTALYANVEIGEEYTMNYVSGGDAHGFSVTLNNVLIRTNSIAPFTFTPNVGDDFVFTSII